MYKVYQLQITLNSVKPFQCQEATTLTFSLTHKIFGSLRFNINHNTNFNYFENLFHKSILNTSCKKNTYR